jgi:hypothetical protein
MSSRPSASKTKSASPRRAAIRGSASPIVPLAIARSTTKLAVTVLPTAMSSELSRIARSA